MEEQTNRNYRCANCGAPLGWDAANRIWKCGYCDAQFTLEEMKAGEPQTGAEPEAPEAVRPQADGKTTERAQTDAEPEAPPMRAYRCSYCGAEMLTDPNTIASVCVYCGSPIVAEDGLTRQFRPRYVIPFERTKQQARETYLSFIRRPFTPDEFLTDAHLEKIQGVYLPFWLYNAQVSGRMEWDCERIRLHRSGSLEITEHDVYHVTRSGSQSFTHVPVDASRKADNAMMDSIEPFDFGKLKPFEMPYLAGFLAERYDEDDSTCYARAKERIVGTVERTLEDAVRGYDTRRVQNKDIRLVQCSAEYALLPVWLLYAQYRGKTYRFAMNGESGAMCGEIPVDPRKMRRCFFLYGGVTALLTFILSLLFLF